MKKLARIESSFIKFIVSLVFMGVMIGSMSTAYAVGEYGCHTHFPNFGKADGCWMFMNNTKDVIEIRVEHNDQGIHRIHINNWDSNPAWHEVAPGEVLPIMVVNNWERWNTGWAYFEFDVRINGGSVVNLASTRWYYSLDFIIAHMHALYTMGVWENKPLTCTVPINGKNYHATIAEGVQGAHPYDFAPYVILTLHDAGGEMPTNLQDTSSDPDKINIMSFNLGSCGAGCVANNNDRLRALRDNAEEFFSDIDVLVLQEAGHKSAHYDPVNLVNDLCCHETDKLFQDRSEFLNGEPFDDFMANNGGVIILAKGTNSIAGDWDNVHPLAFEIKKSEYDDNQSTFIEHPEWELHYVYTQGADECGTCFFCCSGSDTAGPQKGVLKIKYTKKTSDDSSRDYYIIASHTAIRDNNGKMEKGTIPIRNNDFQAMKRIAADLPSDARVLYVGDLNTLYEEEHDNLRYTLEIVPNSHRYFLNYIDPTSNGFSNFYAYAAHGPEHGWYLDWVLPYANQALELPSIKAHNVSMRHRDVEMGSISDHNAVIVEMYFRRRIRALIPMILPLGLF